MPELNSIPKLQPGSLYIALFQRGTTDTFHQTLLLSTSITGGHEFHATNTPRDEHGPHPQSIGPWRYESRKYIILPDWYPTVLVKIGSNLTLETLEPLFQGYPLALTEADEHEPRFNCSIWIREAMRRLHDARFIECLNPLRVEREALSLAKEGANRAASGLEYHIYDSDYSH